VEEKEFKQSNPKAIHGGKRIMKKKSIRKELIILPAVIIILILFIIFSNRDKMYSLPVLPQIDTDKITSITIQIAENTMELKKLTNQWFIMGYEADETKVNDILNTVSSLKLSELITESKYYERYELDDEHKKHVTVYEGENILLTIDIGKTASNYNHTFVKLENNDNIYTVPANLNQYIDIDISGLRDKLVLSFDASLIQEIQIIQGDDTVTLTKVEVFMNEEETDSETPQFLWKNQEGEPRESEKVNELLTTLSNLKCDDFTEEPFDLTNALVSFTLKGDEEYKLIIFEKQEENYPAQSSESEYTFILSGWKGDNILAPLVDLQ
jgi:hypothetical protein